MKVTIDSTKFNRMLKDLSLISGKTFKEVIFNEAARVIEKAIAYTPAAKPPKNTWIEAEAEHLGSRHYDPHNDNLVVTKSKNSGKIWLREKDDSLVDMRYPRKKSHPVLHIMNDPNRRWNNLRWAAFQRIEADRQRAITLAKKELRLRNKRIRGARGLSKNSWYQIALDLKLPIKPVQKYVREAKASNGKAYTNGFGKTPFFFRKDFFVQLVNRYPAFVRGSVKKTNRKKGTSKVMNGYDIIQRAMNTRVSAYKFSLKKGVFSDLKLRAARHPGVFVT